MGISYNAEAFYRIVTIPFGVQSRSSSAHKILSPTSRTLAVQSEVNDQILAQEKALIDETREQAVRHIQKDQEEIKKRYDKLIKRRDFRVSDWVLQRITMLSEQGRLDENWKGTYIVNEIGHKGAYILGIFKADFLEHPWNASPEIILSVICIQV